MKNKDCLATVLKGLWIGGTMTVPGVSGGSMAMITGIYDRLIFAVSSFFKRPRENALFLAQFVAGSAVGMLLFARAISALFETQANIPLRFFFLGAVAGGVPMIFQAAGVRRPDIRSFLCVAAGVGLVLSLSFLPAGLFQPGSGGVSGVLLQLAGGVIIAVGLVLPGISVSHMLYMLGIYERMMEQIGNMDILPLIPLGVGTVGGIFLTTRILEGLMKRYPQVTYLIILGFMFGSLPELFPGIPGGTLLICSALSALLGFCCLYAMSRREAGQERARTEE